MRSRDISRYFVSKTKWPPFCRRHFQFDFLAWNLLYLGLYFTESCPNCTINNVSSDDWFRWWLAVGQTTSHYLNQLWHGFPTHHDDVIKWKRFPRYWPFVRGIHRFPVNFPHKGQCRRVLIFPWICVWINDWVNNREAGDLRRYRAYYDVTLMIYASLGLDELNKCPHHVINLCAWVLLIASPVCVIISWWKLL